MVHNPKLKTKLQELKLRAGLVNYSSVDLTLRSARLTETDFQKKLDQRIVCGYLIVWGKKNLAGEKCIKGCCSKSIQERGPKSNAQYKVTFLWQHKQDDPMALFEILEEDDFGLYFETKPLDPVPSAERTLIQIRSKTLNQFSIGFDYVYDRIEYDKEDDCLVLLEIKVFEGSVVTIGMDQNTFACRSLEDFNILFDEIEDFILTLPRKDRLQARSLFTRQKALIDIEPFKLQETPESQSEPQIEKRKLNLSWITKQL